MKRYVLLLTLSLLGCLMFAVDADAKRDSAEIIVDEDFEMGFLPPGWTSTTLSSVGWYFTDDGSSTYWQIPDHTVYAVSNDDEADDDCSKDYLLLPPIHPADWDSLGLSFDSFFTDPLVGTSSEATVEVNAWGQVDSWQEVNRLMEFGGWRRINLNLSNWCNVNSETLWIAFHHNDSGDDALGWAVDNVLLVGKRAVDIPGDPGTTPMPAVTLSNFPNPFNPETTIVFNLSTPGMVDLDVYNVRGQRVCRLVGGYRASGEHTVVWNGRDDRGIEMSSGVYYCRIATKDGSVVRKMLLMQ